VALAYTKTFAIISVGQMLVRIPLTYIVDPVPFASFGVFWGGITAGLILMILGPVMDIASWIVWKFRVERRSR